MFMIDGIDEIFWSVEQVIGRVMELHPELGDDALIDWFESHVTEDAPYLEM